MRGQYPCLPRCPLPAWASEVDRDVQVTAATCLLENRPGAERAHIARKSRLPGKGDGVIITADSLQR